MKTLTFCVALIVMSCTSVFGQTYKILWSFGGSPNDGGDPVGNLIFDKTGNVYGTTQWGGNATNGQCASIGCGTVFELSPKDDGTWNETVLYNFCSSYATGSCLDGQSPRTGLAFDTAGNLYGTTYFGGPFCPYASAGCGTVFKLSPPQAPNGTWTESLLYSFCLSGEEPCLDGAFPSSHLTFDASGNLYGTTTSGGNGAWVGGTVFELSPGASGWTETVLYNFCTNGTTNHCSDGTDPQAGVTFDNAGNLYGTTALGGTLRGGGGGTVYKLAPGLSGWAQTVLVAFYPNGELGGPEGVVSFDPAGNLYSSANGGGSSGYGGVFRLNSNTKILRGLSFNGTDGGFPVAGVIVASHGNTNTIYGTTTGGIPPASGGSVFKISSTGKLTVLYGFCQQQNCADGDAPYGSVIEHGGLLYGTTKKGGANGFGVVFEVTP